MNTVPRFILSTDRTVQVNVNRVVSVRFRGSKGEKPVALLTMEDGEIVTVSQDEWNRLAPEYGSDEEYSYIPAQPGWVVCQPHDKGFDTPAEGDAIIGWRLPDMVPLTAEQGEPWSERYVIVAPDGKVYRQADTRWDSWEAFIASTKPKPEGSRS